MTSSDAHQTPDSLSTQSEPGRRRLQLRQFQSQLAERMRAARAGTQGQVNQLGVMIGQQRYLLHLQHAGEIVAIGAITQVPLTQDWFLGLTNIRGNLISVIDFARFQGGPSTVLDKECRIVAFASTLSFNSGLLVSRVLGLRNVLEMQLQPDVALECPAWSGQRYLDRDSQVWTELNLPLIVQDTQFLHVGL